MSVAAEPALTINYEWELHTCKRGHTWRFPKHDEKMRCDPILLMWTDADGYSRQAGTGAMCMQCYRDDLVANYGPIKTVAVPKP